ncbi:MAG: bifunctional UDP-N-acetylglucosamine pyrophosphorylase/glucosamine-1-phosphate N-acetyltransferase [Lentimonas sp.]|jgi:bifunctional UDP-N-acetylglucosamine pyrophosphorylase/glucosamine-1-phosphate N-acetyltransferase
MTISVIILAAGKGTRMKSSLPKVLHKLAGREMLNLVIDTAKKLNPENICVVISKEMEKITQQISDSHPETNLSFAIQENQLGTADAVKSGVNSLKNIADLVLVLYADTPLIRAKTLQKMIDSKNAVCVLGFNCHTKNKYGRLIVRSNQLDSIVEFKDASEYEKKIPLCNSGVLAINGSKITDFLSKISNENASGEYYLTDIVKIAKEQEESCGFIETKEKEVMGVNSKIDLAEAENIKQKQIRRKLMEGGVTMLNPKAVYCSYDTKIDQDVIVHPDVFFGTGVEIGANVEIKSFSHIENAKIASGCIIGPFARIRPETVLEENVRIGNFVEVKKSLIKKDAKINHLSYVGDSEIGEKSNIGAGTITCNYDGHKKFKTKIGDNVFVGSNSALVAPVEIGNGAVIGAGSVIISDVSENDLALSRIKQETIKNGGKDYHKKREK